VTGGRIPGFASLLLAALRASDADVVAVGEAVDGAGVPPYAQWTAAVLFNGLGRYAEAIAAAPAAAGNTFNPWFSMWALPELVEAAARSGDRRVAGDALERLVETTQPCATDQARGIEARCRALVSDAEDRFREAIECLGRTRLRPDLARAH